MHSKEEKLSLLSEMISLAKIDGEVKDSEYQFIIAVAEQLGVTKKELDDLAKNEVAQKILKPEAQRILQFQRLVLLMNIDNHASEKEIHLIKDFGFKMGLRPEAINMVLREMHNYPNKMIPSDELIKIFTRFYN
ncbi:TerB family tellurite resistance protein [Aquimarina sp. ERC-38]|uniref:tellurite resistance TerB family protein n=1 Tax=Aquimarina sp. ERC-38 TaxID=2949996 RepID=UPI0022478B2F|nr:TerB family tellurite resistance protein [Aquimarina sp. ERC-38]UZO80791.1 TerB family tellurite resistance protein [Aquimarina sp. ERC-38]